METGDDDGHRLPPCDVPGCERRAVASARGQRIIDLRRLECDDVPETVVLCLPHFEELVGTGARR